MKIRFKFNFVVIIFIVIENDLMLMNTSHGDRRALSVAIVLLCRVVLLTKGTVSENS